MAADGAASTGLAYETSSASSIALLEVAIIRVHAGTDDLGPWIAVCPIPTWIATGLRRGRKCS